MTHGLLETTAPPRRRNWRRIAAAIVAVCGFVFVAANAHLVYVAFASRPDCVPHAKEAGGTDYRAAQSAC